MVKILVIILFILGNSCIAQVVPTTVDSMLNTLRQRKLTYKQVDIIPLKKAPAHVSTFGIKLATRDTLMLISFLPTGRIQDTAGDSSLLKRNPAYLHYTLGQHGSKRGFYYRGKFKTLDEQDIIPLYLDTAIMIVSRLHRYIFTEWKPYDRYDTIPDNIHVAFVFNKNNKLLRYFSYDNKKLAFSTSVGFFNKDELLDVISYDKVEQSNGMLVWHFSLYSFNKKGKVKKKKFHKAGHTLSIPTV